MERGDLQEAGERINSAKEFPEMIGWIARRTKKQALPNLDCATHRVA
jgi:hypothetical protein